MKRLNHLFLFLITLASTVVFAACTTAPMPTPEPATILPPTQTPTREPTATPAPTATSEATPTPAEPVEIDYSAMIAEVEAYLTDRIYDQGMDLGVGFVDIQTGQVISFRGDDRYHAMSTFKGPLAVRYYQMLESGDIEAWPYDTVHLENMLRISYNQHTTCILERTGGVPAFNDWLADEGFQREYNFLLSWNNWGCAREDDSPPSPDVELIDLRYTHGDEDLNLPAGGILLRCPIPQLPCDKAFSPVELAEFYARLYRGELINAEHQQELFAIMTREQLESVFLIDMPEDAPITVYTKGGTFEATEVYRVNFFSEAGIIETPYGAYALTMFMQRQPEWPGTFPMARAARLIYDHFVTAYAEQ